MGFPPWGGWGDPPHKILKFFWDLGNEPFVAVLLWPTKFSAMEDPGPSPIMHSPQIFRKMQCNFNTTK